MSAEKSHWRSHVVLVTIIACIFSVIPFLMGGPGTQIAALAAMILFAATIAAYVTVMKLCGVQLQFVSTARGD